MTDIPTPQASFTWEPADGPVAYYWVQVQPEGPVWHLAVAEPQVELNYGQLAGSPFTLQVQAGADCWGCEMGPAGPRSDVYQFVPEPAATLMLGVGVAFLTLLRRLRWNK